MTNSHNEPRVVFSAHVRWVTFMAIFGLATLLVGYVIGVRCAHEEVGAVRDLPPFTVIQHTEEHLFILSMIEKREEKKVDEYLFITLTGNLRSTNDIRRRANGERFSPEESKEICALLPRLSLLANSIRLASLSAEIKTQFQSELSKLSTSCLSK